MFNETFGQNQILNLIKRLPGMLYQCKNDAYWTMEYISEGCKDLTGYAPKELLQNQSLSYSELIVHQEHYNMINNIIEVAVEKHVPFSYEYQIITKDEGIKWVWEQGVAIYDQEGNVLGLEGFITDITPQKKENERLKNKLDEKEKELMINLSLLNEYKKAVDVSAIVSKTDVNGKITYVNDEFCSITGYSREELIGKPHSIIKHPSTEEKVFKDLWKTLLDKKVWKGVLTNIDKHGHVFHVKSTIVPILDYHTKIKEFISIKTDVTDLVLQEEKIKVQTTDTLTQLPNRQKLLEDLEHDKVHKLAIINIEKFKEINEYYGFETGDCVLKQLASLLLKDIKEKGIDFYKLTGDEFAIAAKINCSKQNFIELITATIQNIKQHKFYIDDNQLEINVVAGIAMQKNFYLNCEMATNYAKETGTKIIVFDDNIQIKETLIKNIDWTNKLKKAIKEDRIIVYAQGILENKNNQINKYECLVRLIDEEGRIVSPALFLNIAKKSKLYPYITQFVIKKSFKFFAPRHDFFSINLSQEDILNKETISFLTQQLALYPGLADRLTIELLEDEGIENDVEINAFIQEMKFLGCKIAIDDFGTGYSNFDYLMKLNVDFIKIDGSIIKNIDRDSNAKLVAELVVRFAKRLGIKTVAEFVHSKEVWDTIKNLGIDYAQGYFINKPKHILEIEN